MSQVLVRKLDRAVIDALKARANRNGRSLEQELREVLTAAAKPSAAEKISLAAKRVSAMTRPVPHALAEDIIREDRDRR